MPLIPTPEFDWEPIVIIDFRTRGDSFSITLTMDDQYEVTDAEIIVHYADTPQLKNRVWRQNRALLEGYGIASAMRRVPITPVGGQVGQAAPPTPPPASRADPASSTSSESRSSRGPRRRTQSRHRAS